MARQHVNVALLAQQMNSRRQQLGIARTMRRVTIQAIFADGRMVPKKRPTLFGMAGVTHIIDSKTHEHLAPLAAMRIVAGSAADLHVAKLSAEQMRGALEQSFSLVSVATETSLFHREIGQHLLRPLGVYDLCRIILWCVREISEHSIQQLRMMDIVARQAAHVATVMLAADPVKVGAIARVAIETPFVRLRSGELARTADIPAAPGLGA